MRDDTHREAVTIDTRVRLLAEPGRMGHVHLIDWGAQRASVRWDSGLISGVALTDIEPVAGAVRVTRPSPATASDIAAMELCPAE